jgi:hypothetical protein
MKPTIRTAALWGLMVVVSILVTTSCGPTPPPAVSTVTPGPVAASETVARTGTTVPPADEASLPVLPNLLVQAEGEVWLRRTGWSDFLLTGFGVAVEPGDLLRVSKGGAASVFCGDQTLWDAGPKALPADGVEHSAPCQQGRPPRPWSDVAALRGEEDDRIPYALHPRNTALLTDRPRLRWHPLPGVSSYTVTLIGDDGQERAPVEASGGEVEWPVDWPPLESRATYVLVVEGDGRRSNQGNEGHVGLGFWLLPAAEAETVQTLEARLRAQPISPTASDLLVAELYRGHDLRAEAAQLLEGLAASDGAAPVWLALGQVYLEAGLAVEAQAALEQALATAQASGQQEAEAAAQVGLGLAARLLDDETVAEEHLQAARALYEQIGDRDRLEQVNRLLSR